MNEQRKRILVAARKLIRYFGVKKTSIEDIASEAGMSKANIYYYFKSKDEICTEVMLIESRKLQKKILGQISTETQLADMLLKYIHYRFAYFSELKEKYPFLFKEFYSPVGGISEIRKNFYQFEEETIRKILSSLEAEREVYLSILKTLIIGYELRLMTGEPIKEILDRIKQDIQAIKNMNANHAIEETING